MSEEAATVGGFLPDVEGMSRRVDEMRRLIGEMRHHAQTHDAFLRHEESVQQIRYMVKLPDIGEREIFCDKTSTPEQFEALRKSFLTVHQAHYTTRRERFMVLAKELADLDHKS